MPKDIIMPRLTIIMKQSGEIVVFKVHWRKEQTEHFSFSANDSIALEISLDLLAFWNLPPDPNNTLDDLGTLIFGVDIISKFSFMFSGD